MVTDSTAYLPADRVQRHGIRVVQVQVVIDGTAFDEGDVEPAALLHAHAVRPTGDDLSPEPSGLR